MVRTIGLVVSAVGAGSLAVQAVQLHKATPEAKVTPQPDEVFDNDFVDDNGDGAGHVHLAAEKGTNEYEEYMKSKNYGLPSTNERDCMNHDCMQKGHVFDGDVTQDQNRARAHSDPHWDDNELQKDAVYDSDFVKDDRNVRYEPITTPAPYVPKTNECGLRLSCRSEEWYRDSCSQINTECDERERKIIEEYNDELERLYREYMKQKGILEDKKDVHAEESAETAAQHRRVTAQKMEVDEAKANVREYSHCPPELAEARDQLSVLEAKPDKLPADIDEECRLKKKIIELERCVENLRDAEEVLYDEKQLHTTEKDEHSLEATEEEVASDAVPPQQRRHDDAKTAWENWKRKGPPSLQPIRDECQAERQALIDEAERDISEAERELRRQKTIMTGREADHSEETVEVEAQEKRVAAERVQVREAKKVVDEHDHCPADLADAKRELARLEATPDTSEADVDAECEVRQRILRLEKCVDRLREAEGVLSKQRGDFRNEKGVLGGEITDARATAIRLPPQEKRVQCAEDSLEEAKAGRRALIGCDAKPTPSYTEPAPAPAPPPPKEKSGASRSTIYGMVALTTMLSALLQA